MGKEWEYCYPSLIGNMTLLIDTIVKHKEYWEQSFLKGWDKSILLGSTLDFKINSIWWQRRLQRIKGDIFDDETPTNLTNKCYTYYERVTKSSYTLLIVDTGDLKRCYIQVLSHNTLIINANIPFDNINTLLNHMLYSSLIATILTKGEVEVDSIFKRYVISYFNYSEFETPLVVNEVYAKDKVSALMLSPFIHTLLSSNDEDDYIDTPNGMNEFDLFLENKGVEYNIKELDL